MNINYSKASVRFLKKQNKNTQGRIIAAIEKIPQGDIVKLIGIGGYRLRVGNFRIIYDVNYNGINIIDIDNRGQIYK